MGIIRIILYIILIFLIFKIVKMILQAVKLSKLEKKKDDAKGGRAPEIEMVLDPVCKAYIEISKALPLKTETGKTYYFCSEKCRQGFLNVGGC